MHARKEVILNKLKLTSESSWVVLQNVVLQSSSINLLPLWAKNESHRCQLAECTFCFRLRAQIFKYSDGCNFISFYYF